MVGAPYHGNNIGNRAVYRFFLGNPAQARAIARAWRVDYVALCDSSFAELKPAFPGPASMTMVLHARPSVWLAPVAKVGEFHVWKVAR